MTKLATYATAVKAQRVAALFSKALAHRGTFEVVADPCGTFRYAILFRSHPKDGHRATAYCSPMRGIRGMAKQFNMPL